MQRTAPDAAQHKAQPAVTHVTALVLLYAMLSAATQFPALLLPQ
jgi:hypothetical protein